MHSKPQTVSSLHRAVEILRSLALAAPAGGQRVSDLSKTLGLSQATTHRLLQQLVEEGLVEQMARNGFDVSLIDCEMCNLMNPYITIANGEGA